GVGGHALARADRPPLPGSRPGRPQPPRARPRDPPPLPRALPRPGRARRPPARRRRVRRAPAPLHARRGGSVLRIVTVYQPAARPPDRAQGDLVSLNMGYIRWLRMSEELARLGHQ